MFIGVILPVFISGKLADLVLDVYRHTDHGSFFARMSTSTGTPSENWDVQDSDK
jgi:hypothetical protein